MKSHKIELITGMHDNGFNGCNPLKSPRVKFKKSDFINENKRPVREEKSG